MSAFTATVVGVTLIRGDDDNVGSESANFKTKNYAIAINAGGQHVSTADTLNVNIATAINNSNREGKTVTLRSIALSKPAYDSKNSAAYAATMTISTNTAVLTIVGSDWSTGADLPANAVLDRPFTVFATVNES